MEGKGNLKSIFNGYKLIIFDLDGTIVRIPVNWLLVRNEIVSFLGYELNYQSIFKSIEEIIAKDNEMREKLFKMIDKHEVEAVDGAVLIDGVRELLTILSRDRKLLLVTLQGRIACELIIKRLDLGKYFLSYITRDDSLSREEQLKIALKKGGISAWEAIFIADRVNDMVAAERVGIDFIMIGKAENDKIAKFNFKSINDLLYAISDTNISA